MLKYANNAPLIGTSLTSVACLCVGFALGSGSLLALGAIGSTYALLRTGLAQRARGTGAHRAQHIQAPEDFDKVTEINQCSEPTESPADRDRHADLETLVSEMLAQGRYAILLRPQIAANLTAKQLAPANASLQDQMALVPDGRVRVYALSPDEEHTSGGLTWVDQVYLDRHPVTNRQYYDFVAAGGYEQMAIWEPEIWPAIFDFVDRTGCAGPRFWQNGRYAPGEEDYPVVGVSWFEAAAYARWVGKRLPTDAEWVKAASWPVTLGGGNHVQRRYPWGEAMDFERANLWASGVGRVAAVDQFEDGVSVGGVYNLIGNVWEWTTGNFEAESIGHGDRILAPGMKNIRGGAFDTYFENHATCQFASGDCPMARRHNIGFRCALAVCDLTAPEPETQVTTPAESEESALEEVAV